MTPEQANSNVIAAQIARINDLEAEAEAAKAEIERLVALNDKFRTNEATLISKLAHAQSWEVSIRAEVGDEPIGVMYDRGDHFKHRAEHLAAKLVDARALLSESAGVLQAVSYLDTAKNVLADVELYLGMRPAPLRGCAYIGCNCPPPHNHEISGPAQTTGGQS